MLKVGDVAGSASRKAAVAVGRGDGGVTASGEGRAARGRLSAGRGATTARERRGDAVTEAARRTVKRS